MIKGTFENRLAVYRNADLTHNITFLDVESVLKAIASKQLPLALIDANSLAGYEDQMKSLSLAIGKIYASGNGFGFVLSDGFEAMETDVRGFVMSQSQLITSFIENQVARLKVNLYSFRA